MVSANEKKETFSSNDNKTYSLIIFLDDRIFRNYISLNALCAFLAKLYIQWALELPKSMIQVLVRAGVLDCASEELAT